LNFKINEHSIIVSDTHFGHFNIKKYEPIRLERSKNSGYSDNIDGYYTDLWNKKVSEEDTVFHLGDLYFQGRFSSYKIEDLNSLNGRKILLVGNHDRPKYYNKLDSNWTILDKVIIDIEDFSQNDYIALMNKINSKHKLTQKEKRLQVCYVKIISGKKIFFSHFPLFNNNEFDNKYKNIVYSLEDIYNILECEVNIHGHIHSHLSNFKDSINVCLEHNEFNRIHDLF